MKCSLTVFLLNGPGFNPVNASTVASTIPDGRLKSAIGMPWLAWVRNACHMLAAVSRATVPRGGMLLSLLPIQAPTTRAGALGSFGGGGKAEGGRGDLSVGVTVLDGA